MFEIQEAYRGLRTEAKGHLVTGAGRAEMSFIGERANAVTQPLTRGPHSASESDSHYVSATLDELLPDVPQ